LKNLLTTVVELVGLVLIVTGVATWSRPAGIVAAGVLCIVVAALRTLRS
jgi:hypothetical protein